ncbi:hypothetical protein [Gimesia aquarii]|uniref:Lipoprotein n=1 Tax=Gimesia aquarii TaxID=2527964 RepID=A0A517WX15_9PLAN|nr:hypothetical protein [Gimesia aquarii]QDU09810.1 hypothetical protein V202x_32070 [Gimesia aquarii]
MKKKIRMSLIHAGALMLMSTVALTLVGCDNKEKVLDVETPGGEIEIERNRDTGAVDVEVDKKE